MDPTTRPKSCLAPDICHRGDIIKQRWEVIEKLGAGTFGQVYKVHDMKTGQYWALKVESKAVKKPVLRMDVAIAKALTGKFHTAAFFACGHEEQFSYMVTQLLGKNLATRKRTSQDGKFPLRTVIRIGIQSMTGIRDLHQAGYLHRDVKPSNLATGIDDRERIVYILDFGLARKFLDDKNRIYPPRPKANFRGTVRYAAPKAHVLQELSRGDDIWSLLYSLVDLHSGRLPWHHIRDMKQVGEAKMLAKDVDLVGTMPATWRRIYSYCKEMSYDSVPDYEHLIRWMNGVTATKPTGIIDTKYVTTGPWEWDLSPNEKNEGSEDDFPM